jgi:hypothetical protein
VPPALRELQCAWGRSLLAGAAGPDAPDPLLLDIYRNTSLGTLSNALSLSFPAVQRLVGAGFFDTAAQEFIRLNPPSSACLNDYGQQFPQFLAQFPHAAHLGYLADVARLEWAVSCALHAADAAPLDLAALAGLDTALMPSVRFVPHPSVTAMRLDTPADAIWRAVLAEDDAAMRAIDPEAGPVWLLIERCALGVQVRRMESGAWHFTQRLCAGEPLQSALEGEGLEAVLADHLASGRFIGVAT